jgi:hemerythrin
MAISPITWSDEISVGVESIDDQHKKLVSIVNTLHKAIVNGKDTEELNKIFNRLFDYTDHHFSYEEELSEKYDYPDIENHKKEHTELKYQIEHHQSMRGLFRGELLVDFLHYWLVNHIMISDKEFASFLIKKGVK